MQESKNTAIFCWKNVGCDELMYSWNIRSKMGERLNVAWWGKLHLVRYCVGIFYLMSAAGLPCIIMPVSALVEGWLCLLNPDEHTLLSSFWGYAILMMLKTDIHIWLTKFVKGTFILNWNLTFKLLKVRFQFSINILVDRGTHDGFKYIGIPSGSDHKRSHIGPSCGTSCFLSIDLIWSRVCIDGDKPPCTQNICNKMRNKLTQKKFLQMKYCWFPWLL